MSTDASFPAPVALFVYARPDHTRRTLEALAANRLAVDTDLVVFADGPRGHADRAKVEDTRAIARSANGFRSVRVVERAGNLGLADNIVSGVCETLRAGERVIVLEDDIVTAPGFLQFMNASLERYRDVSEVWHVSGWNYPIEQEGLSDAFFYRAMNCWGWASWTDRWEHYRRDPAQIERSFTPEMRRAFNLDGAHDFYSQIVDNLKGRRKTWAIFWYATIFAQGGLCLNPAHSLVHNIGLDGTGENCLPGQAQRGLRTGSENLHLPEIVGEHPLALERIRAHLRQSPLRRLRKLAGSLLA